MEVAQGPNWGCSAEGKKNMAINRYSRKVGFMSSL
jgi:hypothetical protein